MEGPPVMCVLASYISSGDSDKKTSNVFKIYGHREVLSLQPVRGSSGG